jgi:adenylosuccinate lyase
MHACLRSHALKAWQTLKLGVDNPLIEDICMDAKFAEYLSNQDIRQLMEAKSQIGNAPERARRLANEIKEIVNIKSQ